MADVHDQQTRSYNMSKIKGKNTKPEMLVRRFLHSHGFRYRLHEKNLTGKPDMVLKKYNTVIFVDGCFWHGHEGCRYFVIPKTRTEWWIKKIDRNKRKDSENKANLAAMGWNVLTVWECELKKNKIEETLDRLITRIRSEKPSKD